MIEFFRNIHFLQPEWLWGLIPCALIALLLKSQDKTASAWRNLISAHLFKHQKLNIGSATLLQPRHIFIALLILGCISLAGPSWQRDIPEALDEQAALLIILDNDLGMYASDVAPTRNLRAKQKIKNLLAMRPKAQVGLISYAGTAHAVVPVTEDPEFISLFLEALEPSLMPEPGHNLAAAFKQANELLEGIDRPANIVLVTDSLEDGDIDLIENSNYPVQVLAIGTADGGPLKLPKGFKLETPVNTRLPVDQFVALRDAGESVIGVSIDNSDLQWLNQRIESATESARNDDPQFQWQNNGYTLVWLLIPLALLWFRKGWTLYSLLLMTTLTTSFTPQTAQADFIDWWFTADQQGQMAFNSGDYKEAAAQFADPYRKGLSLYHAGKYKDAQEIFTALGSADACFYEGNSYAQQKLWDEALLSFNKALALKPEFPEATANRKKIAAIMVELEKKRKGRLEEQREEAMDKADEIKVDEKGNEGVEVEMTKSEASVQPENWLNGLKVTPAQLLRNKFQMEAYLSEKTASEKTTSENEEAENE